MNQLPTVSVIIPSFNRAETIVETLNSIIQQKCSFDYEIIIGDDCSTDNSRVVLIEFEKKYPELIRLIFHDSNLGLSANWATCVKAAKGKYICNCDNDDYWHNDHKMQMQVDYFKANPNENVLITNHRTHNRITGEIIERTAWIDRSLPLQEAIFSGKYSFCNATIMYRADFLKRHVNLDDYINYRFTLQDWNTWVILSAYTDFSILPYSTATFGFETTSITRPSTFEQITQRFEKEKECYKYVCDLFPNNLKYDAIGYESYVNSVLLNLAYSKRDFKSANSFSRKVKRIKRITLKSFFASNVVLFNLFFIIKYLRTVLKS